MRGAEHGDDLIDEAEIIFGKHAETVANFVDHVAGAEIELDVPGVFFRAFLVQPTA